MSGHPDAAIVALAREFAACEAVYRRAADAEARLHESNKAMIGTPWPESGPLKLRLDAAERRSREFAFRSAGIAERLIAMRARTALGLRAKALAGAAIAADCEAAADDPEMDLQDRLFRSVARDLTADAGLGLGSLEQIGEALKRTL